MAQTQRLQFIIDAQNKAEATLKGVSKNLDQVKSKVESFQPAFQKMAVAGTAALVGITALVKSSTEAYAEAERAERQLYNAVVNVSKGTKEQAAAIGEAANALQKKAGIDGDALKMGAAQLSTFGLQSESVVALTKSLADLTVNQNGVNASSDAYITSANVMAKALNGQFGALEKSGIRFTAHQQELIMTGTEVQKVAALQEGLAQNLRETTDTISGVDLASAKYKQTLGDIQENIGKAMIPALTKLSEALLPILEKFAAWAEANPDLLAKIIMVTAAIAGIITVVGTLGLVLPSIITGFTALGTVLTFLSANPIVLVVAALAFLILKFNELIQVTGGFKEAVIAMGDTIISWWKKSGEWLYGKIEGLVNIFKKLKDTAGNIAGKAVDKIFGSRAIGGPVAPGKSYLVGEKGPEMFTPNAYGRIATAKNTAGGGGIHITLTGNSFMGREGIAEQIGNDIIKQLQLRMKLTT